MKKIKFKILFVAMLIILTGMNSSSSLIICLETDGHVQIELEKKSQKKILSNSSNSNNKNLNLSISSSGDKNCEDCFDIPILFNYISNNDTSQSGSFLKNKIPTNAYLSNLFGILKKQSLNIYINYKLSKFLINTNSTNIVLLI